MKYPQKKKIVSVAAEKEIQPAKTISKKWLYVFVGFVAFLLYANTLQHDYTVDDGTVIGNNSYTKQGTAALGKIFTSAYRAGFWERKEGLYRPISVAMFAIEWQLAPNKPFLGHLLNVFFYVLTAVVLLSVLQRLLKSLHPLIPLIVTLLFVAHPIHTEVVANIKSRDELLSFFFGLVSLRFLFQYLDDKKTTSIIIAILCYFIGLFSKESSITWVGIFPLALWCSGNCTIKKTIQLSLPFLFAAAAFMVVRRMVLGPVPGGNDLMLINNSLIGATSTTDRFATAFSVLGNYLWLLVFPVKLSFDYSYNTIPNVSFSSFSALLPLLIYSLAVVYGFRNLKEKGLASLGIFIFMGTIALVANIFFLIEATMAERFLYTPSFGFCIVVGVLADKLISYPKKKEIGELTVANIRSQNKLVLPAILILLLFGGRTIARNNDWKNNLTLLEKDVQTCPNSARIRYAYGSALLIEKALKEENNKVLKDRDLDAAIGELQKGVSILANYNDAWYHLGIAFKEKNDAKNAVAAFDQARSYRAFSDAEHFTASGIAYGMNGQYDKSIADLKQATLLDPKSPDAWNNLGLYYSESGNKDSALLSLQRAISLKKDFDKAYYNVGNAYAKTGDYNNAMKNYTIAIGINPTYSDAFNNMGNCYAAMRQPMNAKPWFEKAVNADPENAKALLNLGVTLNLLGDSVAGSQMMARAQGLNMNR